MKNNKFVLHVGPMKTATTYTQYILSNNRSSLKEKGWIYPGNRTNQQHAFYGICGEDIPWIKIGTREKYQGLANSLIRELTETEENIIVSSEALAALEEEGIERLLKKIPMPTCIVFTIRSMETTLKSGWQQFLKGGASVTLEDFAKAAMGDIEIGDNKEIPRTYLYGEAVKRWSKMVDCNINLAEVPVSSVSQNDTWAVFRAAGNIPELNNLYVPSSESNISLSQDAAELLRRFNESFMTSKLLRQERQREFVYNCLLAEPTLKLGDEKITLHPDLKNRILKLEKIQREEAYCYATAVIKKS